MGVILCLEQQEVEKLDLHVYRPLGMNCFEQKRLRECDVSNLVAPEYVSSLRARCWCEVLVCVACYSDSVKLLPVLACPAVDP